MKEEDIKRLILRAEDLTEDGKGLEFYGEDLREVLERERDRSRELSSKKAWEVAEILKGLDDKDERLRKEVAGLAERFEIEECIKKDGRVEVKVSQDKLKAWITIYPHIGGGKRVEFNDCLKTLTSHGVVFGISEQAIKDTIKEASEEGEITKDALVAEGKLPTKGEGAKIDYRFDTSIGYKERGDGSIDFREINLIKNVKCGDILAIKTPPSIGSPGRRVTGEEIPAELGEDVDIVPGRNVKITDDGVKFIAELDGQVVLEGNKIRVDPVYVVEGDVDFNTGNISFVGNVIINGRVLDGFKVESKGDVIVYDNIGAADINASGSVLVQNGIVGKGKGQVVAEGDVSAKFVENANILAKGDITIRQAAINSNLSTNGRVLVNRGRGTIVGGLIKAKKGVEARVIGSDFGTPTEIIVGEDFFLQAKLKRLNEEIEARNTELSKVKQIVDIISQGVDELDNLSSNERRILIKAIKKKTELRDKIEGLDLERVRLLIELKEREYPGKIWALDTIHPDVKVRIKGASLEINSPLRYATLFEDKGEIKIGTYG